MESAYARKKLRKYAARKRQENNMDEEALDYAWVDMQERIACEESGEDNDDEETEEE